MPTDEDVEGAEGFYGTPRLARIRDYSRDGVLASVEASLRRLGTDRIDMALIHDPDDYAAQALDGANPALTGLRAAGVVSAIGVGMNQVELLEWFLPRTDLDCVLVAGRYSLLDGAAADRLLPRVPAPRRGRARRRRLRPAACWLIRARAPPTTTSPPPSTWWTGRGGSPPHAPLYGVPLGAVALQFTLRHPAITAAVIGARTAAEITEDAGYLDLRIPETLFEELAGDGLIPAATRGS